MPKQKLTRKKKKQKIKKSNKTFELENWNRAKEGDIIKCFIKASIDQKQGEIAKVFLNSKEFFGLSKVLIITNKEFGCKSICYCGSFRTKNGIFPKVEIKNLKVLILNEELVYVAESYKLLNQ